MFWGPIHILPISLRTSCKRLIINISHIIWLLLQASFNPSHSSLLFLNPSHRSNLLDFFCILLDIYLCFIHFWIIRGILIFSLSLFVIIFLVLILLFLLLVFNFVLFFSLFFYNILLSLSSNLLFVWFILYSFHFTIFYGLFTISLCFHFFEFVCSLFI